uniref:Adenosine 3'-phospho 5'-phosphosulfate transporter 2 n=1 Tax=Xenopsylla cheopis TaxID=163159 RepID=A0A6M2DZ47_XENCH
MSPNFNTTGIIMISLALLCDAVIGNVQEKAMKEFSAPNAEVVLYSYSIGFIYLFIILLATNNLLSGIQFCAMHPYETYGYGLLFSLTGYLGIQIVLTLVCTCGAPTAASVTTARKAVTIALSFVFFNKPFTMQYVWSGCIVLLGIYLNMYSKRNPDAFNNIKQTVNSLYYSISDKIRKRTHSPNRRLLINI